MDEGTETYTYTAVLRSAPTVDVTVMLTVPTELTATPTALTFSAATWNTRQTVTVSTVDDDDARDETVTITHSVSGYGDITMAPDLSIEVMDDEVPVNIGFERSTYVAREDVGGTQICAMVTSPAAGAAFPSGMAQVRVASTIREGTDTAEASDLPTLTPAVLTFASDSRRDCTIVTIPDDDIPEESETFALTLTVDTTNSNFDVILGTGTAVMTVEDDDNVEVQFSASAYEVMEEDGVLTYTLQIVSPATTVPIERADFTLAVTAESGGGTAVAGADFTAFSNRRTMPFGDTSRSQTGTVMIIDDTSPELAETFSLVLGNVLGEPFPVGVTARQTVTVTIAASDRVEGVTIAPTALTVEEGTDTLPTYTVVLQSVPTGPVTVTPTVPAELTAAPTALTFSTTSWNTRQTVAVSAVDDADYDDETVTITHSVSGYDPLTRASSVTITVMDDDTNTVPSFVREVPNQVYTAGVVPPGDAAILILPPATGGNGALSYVLTGDLPLGLRWVFTGASSFLLGTPTTATAAVTMTYTVADADIDMADSDTASLIFTITVRAVTIGFEQSRYLESEGTGTFQVCAMVTYPAAGEPFPAGTAQAMVTSSIPTGGNPAEASDFTAVSAALTFSSSDRRQCLDVTLTGDNIPEETEPFTLTLTEDRANSDFDIVLSTDTAAVNIEDDDPIRMQFSRASYDIGEEDGAVTFTVEIASPGSSVPIELPDFNVTVSAMVGSGDSATGGTDFQTFTRSIGPFGDTQRRQTGMVRITDDATNEGAETFTLSLNHDSTTPRSIVEFSRVESTVTIAPSDRPDVTTIAPTALTVEEGRETTYTVVLRSAPTVDITVTPTVLADLTPTPAALTFTTTTWSTPQTVTVAAAQDDDARDDTITITHTVTGYGSVVAPAPVTVTVTDIDMDMVNVAPTSLTVDEGDETTYTVVLDTEPAGDVTVTLALPAELTNGGALTFSPTTWNTHQTVTVTAQEDSDFADDTVTITHTVGGYGRATDPSPVTVVVDDTTDGVIITATAALSLTEGATTTYSVVLTTRPAGDVIVTPSAGASDAVTVSPALTFTATTWSTPQTVTVVAVQDYDARDDTATIRHTVTGYGSVADPAPITVTVADPDTDGVTITPTTLSLRVVEGTQTIYTVMLDTQPLGDVTVVPALPAALTTRTTALIFSTSTWSTPQTVTVTAVRDDDADDATVDITHTVTGGYDSVDVPTITVTVMDDDTPGVTITSTDLTSTALSVEEGSQTTYTVVLDTRPAGEVRVTPVPPAELTTATSVLIFNADTWRTVQTVTVMALTDADGDDATVTITHRVTGYGDVRSATVTVVINDPDDTAKESIADLNRLILPELTRAMADQEMNAISGRIRSAKGAMERQLTIGGQSTMMGMLTTHGRAAIEGNLNLKTLLGGSSFVLPLHASAAGQAAGLSGVTIWGGGDYRGLSGEGDTIDWDGGLFSARVGADTRVKNLLAGVAVSWSEAELDYDYGATFGTGDYDVDLVGVHPYLGWKSLNGRLDAWATAGYGWGELQVNRDDEDPATSRAASDITMKTLGAGGSLQLLESHLAMVRVKGEVLHGTMDVEASGSIRAMKVESRRMRLGLEASRTHKLADGGQLIPTVEVGMRHDAGDGRTGTGAEVGGKVQYIDPAHGLTVESHGRVLVGHGGGYEDWGIGGLVRLDAGSDGQGLSFSLQPTWGATASRVAQVWAQEAATTVSQSAAPQSRDGRVDMNLGYGLNWGEALVTPYSRLTLTNSRTRAWRLGSRVNVGSQFSLNLEGTRQETVNQPVDHGIMVQIGLGF